MVTDVLANASIYAALGPRIARGLQFLAETDLKGLTTGRHELDGQALFVLVSDYVPKPPSQGKWEAHRRYLDLQFVVSGVERIGCSPLDRLQAGEYDPEKDITWLSGPGDFLTLSPGSSSSCGPATPTCPASTQASPARSGRWS
jgi:YhcH/YjgK/YiaL family protein